MRATDDNDFMGGRLSQPIWALSVGRCLSAPGKLLRDVLENYLAVTLNDYGFEENWGLTCAYHLRNVVTGPRAKRLS